MTPDWPGDTAPLPHQTREDGVGRRVREMGADEAARWYDPASNDYDLTADPRCLWGWGPPERGCTCRSGHACFRAFGHPGECWDAGGPLEPAKYRRKCDTATRPADWDARGRTEANR